jgi:hypothetical protein
MLCFVFCFVLPTQHCEAIIMYSRITTPACVIAIVPVIGTAAAAAAAAPITNGIRLHHDKGVTYLKTLDDAGTGRLAKKLFDALPPAQKIEFMGMGENTWVRASAITTITIDADDSSLVCVAYDGGTTVVKGRSPVHAAQLAREMEATRKRMCLTRS